MHIPDGFLGPQTWLPAAGVAALGWTWAVRRVRRTLHTESVPTLGVITACSFGLMLVTIPLPGGTTIHATGIGLLALRFGVAATFLSVSLVLALQALLLGDGGLTTLPVTALALGLVGGGAVVGTHRLCAPFAGRYAVGAAAFVGVVAAAFVAAIVLGLQPLLSHGPDGAPLYFPFGLRTTLPAVVLPHLLVGVLEAALTMAADRLLRHDDKGGRS